MISFEENDTIKDVDNDSAREEQKLKDEKLVIDEEAPLPKLKKLLGIEEPKKEEVENYAKQITQNND